MTYRNLLDQKQPRIEGQPIEFSHRGASIVADGQTWHYIIKDALIATRPNRVIATQAQLFLHRAVIDGLLDGSVPVSEPVFQHLTNHGFKPKSYHKQERFIAQQEKDFSR